jgi:tetratricopeptide (TPR) repeat protein
LVPSTFLLSDYLHPFRIEKEEMSLLIKKFEAFDIEEHPERNILLRLEVFNILNELTNHSSDDLHIWGLTYYMSDDDKEHRTHLVLEKFLQSYELDTNNFLACLYIAHCYHDKGELEEALKYYELINKNKLKEFQNWRYVKLFEQIEFCNYKLGNEELGRTQFQEVLDLYKKSALEYKAYPTEMLQCLPESDEIIIEIMKIDSNS